MRRDPAKADAWRKRSKRLNPVSAKRRAENRERSKILDELRGSPCQARLSMCTGRGVDGHEILSRGRGGSITDRANIRWLCRRCHSWITEHPAEAERLGWLVPSWEKP